MKKIVSLLSGFLLLIQANAQSSLQKSPTFVTIIVVGTILFLFFSLWSGIKKPLFTTISFLGTGLIGTLIFFTNYEIQYNLEARNYMSAFIIICFGVGFLYLYLTIEMKKKIAKVDNQQSFSSTNDNLQSDIYTQIKSLNELKEKGIISEAEFQEKKQKLLSKI